MSEASDFTCRQLAATGWASTEPADALGRACTLLAGVLRDGPRQTSQIITAAENTNVSEGGVQRAAAALGVVKTKARFGGGWVWERPANGERAAA